MRNAEDALGLEAVFEKVGRSLSDKFGIRLLCRGDQCRTDGTTIYLPALPEEMPKDLYCALRGHLDHEIGHIVFSSDTRILREFEAKWGKAGSFFLNVLEDVRVEAAMRQKYPGSGCNLVNAHTYLEREILARPERPPVSIQLAFALGSVSIGKPIPRFVGREVVKALGDADAIVRKAEACRNTRQTAALAERLWPAVRRLLEQKVGQKQSLGQNDPSGNPVGKGNGKQEARDQAGAGQQSGSEAGGQADGDNTESANAGQEGAANSGREQGAGTPGRKEDAASEAPGLGEEEDEESDVGGRDGNEEGGDNRDGQTAHGNDQANGQGADDRNAANASYDASENSTLEGQGEGDGSQSADGRAEIADDTQNGEAGNVNADTARRHVAVQASTQNSDSGSMDPEQIAGPGVMEQLAGLISERVAAHARDTRTYRPWTREYDRTTTARDRSTRTHRERIAGVMPLVTGVRQHLLQALLAEPRARWLGDQEEGRINPVVLHRLVRPVREKGGNPRVFRRKVRKKRLRTAVTLLVDESGSMQRNGKRELAADTALVFCEALSRLGVKTSVVGFTTANIDLMNQAARQTCLQPGELACRYRLLPLRHTVYKRFDEQ
ncbi:MAG: hypothetical protein LBE84_02465, partial [Planctomycetota bacterium]|nr:hypothetical protein [Planctomycetota bacterium]